MKIELHKITVRELVEGYVNSEEEGVVAYGGRLDVRPKYQREFIYKPEQQAAVIDTVTKGYPLNVMYWAVRGDGTYEVIDGQQRTLSVCEYVAGKFAYMFRYFGNLAQDEQDAILDYELTVYFCEGTESEKLEWFKTINIAGEELTEQELLNAVYAGPWTADMKRYFSRPGGPAEGLGGRYMRGDPIRQDYMATVLKWRGGGDVKSYMAIRQHEPAAADEWLYFKTVVAWVETLFLKYRREMKGVEWGRLYNEYKGNSYDPAALELLIKIYTPYVFSVLRRKLGSMAQAEDIEELASNVFFSLWQHRKRFRSDNPRAWLAKVAANEAKSWLRQQHLHTVSTELVLELSDSAAERMEDSIERSLILQEALERLDEETREILVRCYRERQTVAEIAAALNMKLPTVKSRLQRGRKKLQQYLEQGG